MPVGPGELGVGWYVGWVDEYEVQTTSDLPAEQFAGTIGGFAGSYPEWKWLMDLRNAWRDLEVGLAWRYVDSTVDTSRFDFKTTEVTVPHKETTSTSTLATASMTAGSTASRSAPESRT